MNKSLRALWVMVVTAFRADRWRAIAVFALTAFSAFFGTLGAYWLGLLTDGAVHHNLRPVAIAAGAMGLSALLSGLVAWYGFNLRTVLMEKTSLLVDRQIVEITAGLPGIEHHERADYQNELALLRLQRDQLSRTISAIVQGTGVVVQAAVTLSLLAYIHPLLLLLPLFGLPSIWTGARAINMSQNAMEATIERERVCTHLFELATTAASGKELRIFGLRPELVQRHRKLWNEVNDERLSVNYKAAMLVAAGWLVFVVGYAAAIVFVVAQTAAGDATPGMVITALTLGAQINGQVEGVVGTMGSLFQSLRVAGRLLWLVDYADEASIVRSGERVVPQKISTGISVRDMKFVYPGTDWEVLAIDSLDIPAGTTVAIVGENGAGKTTLVKLLMRAYDPTEGSIALDSTDIREFSMTDWRSRLSAGFQDFVRFEFLARQAVGVGDLAKMDDLSAVEAAMQRAQATDAVATLPSGLDTQLGRNFDDGVDLSGGQWQKLALARAMMRPAPLVLLLDEPTASLDAETEYELFRRYAEASKRLAETTGTITVLVSHRFSTVRMADLIVVMNNGGVEAVGTHEELIASGGLYAELYEMQARSYREDT